MLKKKKIKIPIYFGNLIVILTDDLNNIGYKGVIPDMSDCYAYCFKENSNGFTDYYIVLDIENVKPSIIAHEALHCVGEIFEDRGIKMDINNDEPQCYLLGWVVKQCHEFLNKNK